MHSSQFGKFSYQLFDHDVKVDTKIHHVEHWGSILQNINGDGYNDGRASEEDQEMVKSAGSGVDIETLKATDYYKQIAGYGKNVQKVSMIQHVRLVEDQSPYPVCNFYWSKAIC